MSWLTPLGFLGFNGLIILIIIYIIKPNYQNKIISSTFIWKLSLKLRKKKIPVSKLRNILLFICQMLAICALTFIVAQPFIEAIKEPVVTEKVVILDASASMMTESDGETRFERAVESARTLAYEAFEQGSTVTVLLAGEKASVVVANVNAENALEIDEALDALLSPEDGEEPVYTFGKGDIDGAIKLAEQTTLVNPDAEVVFFTDTNYIDAGRVVIKDVKDPSEWNAAILDTRAIIDENYYRFEIDIACYGNVDADIDVYCDIYGVNDDDMVVNLFATARCKAGEPTTLVFAKYNPDKPDADITESVEIFSFNYLSIRINENDSFEYDNTFSLHGGEKPPLRIQYASSSPNNFFGTAMMVLRDTLNKRWKVEFVEVKKDETPEIEGFDVYIFEHKIPKTLPNDGLLILANPDSLPSITGLRLGGGFQSSNGQGLTLSPGDEHVLMDGITPEEITVTRFKEFTSADGYVPLMYCENKAVVMAKNEPDQKIVAMSFSLNYSNFSMLLDFPLFMYNIFEHYIPSTMSEHVFEVNDEISLNCRSEYLMLTDPNNKETELRTFPDTVLLKTPGLYKVSQTPISGEEISEYFFVKLPASESDINTLEDTLSNPFFVEREEIENQDLLLYFALALIALLFAEWWLQSREQF
ncbi:MAG: VWA domain-containing protein [Ruminococcaceae bacterium]|nr:VWA domain-containing protein [Oscillospiraceae bacterium]